MEKPLILIVEDEPSIADSLSYALDTEGFDVHHCLDGASGMASLQTKAVALVLLDVGLPDTNGFDWCREARKTSDVPIIFLTARSDEVDRIVGLEIGADDYVSKPFSPREVPGRVFFRSDLMPAVWEDPGASMDRTVDAHIKLLQGKLREIDPAGNPIKTHRGLGYSWSDEG